MVLKLPWSLRKCVCSKGTKTTTLSSLFNLPRLCQPVGLGMQCNMWTLGDHLRCPPGPCFDILGEILMHLNLPESFYRNYENSLHIRCSSLPSSLPPCIVMFYHPAIFSLFGSLFTTPGHTERDNSPSPAFSWTTNRAFRVQNRHNILKCIL